MWDRYIDWLERRRARTLVDSLGQWRETCDHVTKICSQALNDPASLEGDIGVVLDTADRKLFHLRNEMTDARRELKRHDSLLAKRLTQVTEDVYNLRNLTARFLIRAQGPHPLESKPIEANLRNAYYYKALEEVGYQGRELADRLQNDTDNLWDDLQTPLDHAYKTLQV